MEDKVIEKTKESINRIIEEGITTNNLDHLYKLSKIKHLAKEDKDMYDNYGARQPGYDSYGRDYYRGDSYGRRGYDMKYRGHDHLERMSDSYGRYMEGRTRYGANEDTLRSLEYMLQSAVDFFEMLKSEANSQEEMNMVRKYAQKIAQM